MIRKSLTTSALLLLFVPLSHSLPEKASVKTTNLNYWFPQKLDLSPLRQNKQSSNPYGDDFNYAKAFQELNFDELYHDLNQLMTESQDWWPADFGNYGPFFIRMSWHSAGTYRVIDGRGGAEGGMQRYAPINSWPDNANLDKARRLLWPIKEKYGEKISWSDLLVLAGNVAMENMGFKTIGFAGGRIDEWQAEPVNWGGDGEWLSSNLKKNNKIQLKKPFGATQMGLIYVNPEGPRGEPDPLKAAAATRIAFGRMAMNDEETVALIAGGHAFGKAHGAANTAKYLGKAPEYAPINQQGLGWKNSYKTGKGPDTITSGLEGAWTASPIRWSHNYLQNLFNFEWEKTKSPGGAVQWTPKNQNAKKMVPDAFDSQKRHAPMMFTTDIALKEDPAYRKIAKYYLDNPQEFEKAFANAWFKLIHRDMGPRSRYLGPWVPKQAMIWQDPVPAVDYQMVQADDIQMLKSKILDSGLSSSALIRTAWASASTYRATDKRGGANGARIQLLPQKNWDVNNPKELEQVLTKLKQIQQSFNDSQAGNKKISLADLIILAGDVAIKKAADKANVSVNIPFYPGRTDATQDMTDIKSFEFLKPVADGFRNYVSSDNEKPPEQLLIEKASLLNLTVPEMTVLIGGMRVLNANANSNQLGVLTDKPGTLSNDYFVNLIDMSTVWNKSGTEKNVFVGQSRKDGNTRWKATAVDLVFGSDSELRAVTEVYATKNANQKFVKDFVNAWVKVMTLDRYDLQQNKNIKPIQI